MALQRTEHRLDVPLAVAEHDGVLEVFRFVDQLAQRLALVEILAAGCDHLLGDRVRGRRGAGHLDPGRIVQEGIDQTLDLRRHGCREEQGLTGHRDQLADPLDVGNEAHVEHAVGFVDHEDINALQQQLAALGVVEQASRRRDQNVDAAVQLAILIPEGRAADQQRDVQAVVDAISVEVFLDLGSEFARRLENERARHARSPATLLKQRQHRQCEGRRLSGAGLGEAQNVTTFKHMRNCRSLNGGGLGVPGGRDGGEYFFAQSK